ncbi:hypothetical protein Lqui_2579 [Legionella quinlivanii]|uniref:Uncharacterized protein n=1 Tax=Legionella quinlivanii TaxID=45073 RepID=A0A0W0XN95_9GAMM|nr:hypothetical protein [Legionella quinlivanii]KTD46089.1 hypothetical protein Lqui_2579 [Legionella quinlivanii]MCW8451221.1 hypothetical protein [Legionella quinlivanii]SEG28903.1 hypothetical protein SAMN02746093_02433 [Legionella quinlivanii DSM 21216]STY10586.1 Uncharacterised protein [Legionella quinlivanii]
MLRFVMTIFMLINAINAVAKDTELEFYHPFEGVEGLPVASIESSYTGECVQQSQRIKREDAWRCVAGGQTYDPCFIKPYGKKTQAFCPESPWSTQSVEIKLRHAAMDLAQASLDLSRTYPWVVELSTGEKCKAVDEGEMFDGLPIHYRCENQSILMGHLQRCKAEWSMLKREPNGQVDTVLISKAWF